jgi:hypothetical protein
MAMMTMLSEATACSQPPRLWKQKEVRPYRVATHLVSYCHLLHGGQRLQRLHQHVGVGRAAHQRHEATQLLGQHQDDLILVVHRLCSSISSRRITTGGSIRLAERCIDRYAGEALTIEEGDELLSRSLGPQSNGCLGNETNIFMHLITAAGPTYRF